MNAFALLQALAAHRGDEGLSAPPQTKGIGTAAEDFEQQLQEALRRNGRGLDASAEWGALHAALGQSLEAETGEVEADDGADVPEAGAVQTGAPHWLAEVPFGLQAASAPRAGEVLHAAGALEEGGASAVLPESAVGAAPQVPPVLSGPDKNVAADTNGPSASVRAETKGERLAANGQGQGADPEPAGLRVAVEPKGEAALEVGPPLRSRHEPAGLRRIDEADSEPKLRPALAAADEEGRLLQNSETEPFVSAAVRSGLESRAIGGSPMEQRAPAEELQADPKPAAAQFAAGQAASEEPPATLNRSANISEAAVEEPAAEQRADADSSPVFGAAEGAARSEAAPRGERPTPVQAPPGPNFQELAERIVQQVRFRTGADQAAVEMKFKPELLGELSLRMSLEQGALQAQFFAESEAAKRLIEGALPQLRDALFEQGVQVESLTVQVGDHQDASGLTQREQQARPISRWPAARGPSAPGAVESASPALNAALWGATRVNILA